MQELASSAAIAGSALSEVTPASSSVREELASSAQARQGCPPPLTPCDTCGTGEFVVGQPSPSPPEKHLMQPLDQPSSCAHAERRAAPLMLLLLLQVMLRLKTLLLS